MPGRKLCQRSDGRAFESLCSAGRDRPSRTGGVVRAGRSLSFAATPAGTDCSAQLSPFGELCLMSRADTLPLEQAINRQRQRREGMAEILGGAVSRHGCRDPTRSDADYTDIR
ncbi:hypothetical protein ACFFGH_02905 [Lysobacter korlensis]|uniref:Uncharacterized protein n=1 Tax=Lysobacter korlensis TaxID=553636 RepID=A0ABV6RIJ9_9GAMM